MGSRSRATVQTLPQATLLQIEERLGPALDPSVLEKPEDKDHSRERIFSLTRTFWCWIWQVLQGNTSCREVVRQIQALFAAFSRLQVDEGTSAYCQARKKLADSLLEKRSCGANSWRLWRATWFLCALIAAGLARSKNDPSIRCSINPAINM